MKALCAALALLTGSVTSSADFSVRVESGATAMSNVVVRVPVPADFPQMGMLSGVNEFLPFQKATDGTVVFILPQLGAQSIKRFKASNPPNGTSKEFASADLENGRITLSAGGKKIFVYQGTESDLPRPDIKPQFKRGGYIHPVFSPSGKQITDDYPANHIHHHGIWFPWTKTSFEGRDPDFWNMGEQKGKVEFAKFNGHWSGVVHAGLQAEHRFIDLTSGAPKPVLNETWQLTAYHLPRANYFAFDLVSTQSCATSSPLILPKYYYGGLGLRGNWAWNGEENCSFLTSNGETDRVKGNETRGNWAHMGGTVDGQFTGIAILSHPENFRSPQPMRLHPKEPFFCFAPSQVDDWKIEPGKPYVSKYRFIVSDGPPDKNVLDQLWQAYANPPKVVIEKL